MVYRIIAKAFQTAVRIAGGTGERIVVRVGNRAAVAKTKVTYKAHRDLALRKIGLEYEKLPPLSQKFIDETHEVISRTVTGFSLDIAKSEWDGLKPEERARVYKTHLYSACRRAVFARINSNMFDIGFDLGARGDQLRLRYASQKDPDINFMDDYEWLKVLTMSLMDFVLQEMDSQH